MNATDLQPIKDSSRQLTFIIYALYLASFFIGITALAAIIINYLKKDEVANTYLASHFRWQIRTFWFGLLWAAIGAISLAIGVGVIILIANGVWMLYRMIRGILALNDRLPMYPAS